MVGGVKMADKEYKNEDDVIQGVADGNLKVAGTDKQGATYFVAASTIVGDMPGKVTSKDTHGSQPIDDSASMEETEDDRSVRIHIDRDDEGCLWAFENDIVVYRNVMRLCSILNNGYEIICDKENKQAEKAKEYMISKLNKLDFRRKYNSIIMNRAILGWSPVKKVLNKHGNIVGLVELDPKDCNPIRNLSTGELGGKLGKGLDPKRKNAEISLVQQGNIVQYDQQGNPSYTNNWFYFTREEVMFFTLGERGKFKCVSPVKRALRLIEAKKTIENIVELVCRRYGPQVWVVVGNENVNLATAQIPQKYFRSEGGGDGTAEKARELYRKDIFSNLNTLVTKWSTGETLAMLAEYGLDVKVINPSANLPKYIEFIQMYSDFIKNGIFGLDFPGRIDVTSSKMLERLPRDLEDSLALIRDNDFSVFNNELIKPLLKQGGYSENILRIEGKPLDRLEIERNVEVERMKSATIFNYARSGYTKLPPKLVEEWGFDLKDLGKEEKIMSKDRQHPEIGKPIPKGSPGPIEQTSR